MKRKQFIKNISIATAGLTLSPYLSDIFAKDKRYNFIFIMTDDHAYQAISSYGSKINKTPNIDRLAKEGVLFEQSFVTNSICGPSRACMLTGKYNHLNGMIDNSTAFDGSQQTFIKLLRDSGYTTSIIGKWHLKSEPTGFDYWNILPGQGQYYNPDFIEMGEQKRVEGYATDLITDFALDWLNKRDNKKPFCLLLHHKAPHRNWQPGPKHLTKYDDEEIPIPETFYDDYSTRTSSAKEQEMEIDEDMYLSYDLKVPLTEEEKIKFANEKLDNWWKSISERMTPKQRADWNKAYKEKNEIFKNSNLKGKKLAEWKYQRYIKDYLRCVASVDDNIGRVLDYVEENNLSDNTIIIYTSDQGFYLGEHGWFDKRFMYEESQKTPLIIKVPNAKKGITNSENMVVNIDYAPTFLDYAGVKIPNDMQGKSLKKIIEGTNPNDWRTSVYYHYFEYPAEHNVRRHYGIRTQKYKLIHFYYDVDEWELYDLENDPHELNNIYDKPENKDLIIELKKELDKLRVQYDDTDETKFLPQNNMKVEHKGIGADVKYVHNYSKKYSGDNNVLFDGLCAPQKLTSHVDLSIWQGFKKNDLIAEVVLPKTTDIKSIRIGFLQFSESWIFLPEWVHVLYSLDNKNFNSLGKLNRKSDIKSTKIFKENFDFNFEMIKAKYIKIISKNIGLCPDWHQGSGKPAWIFSDEVIIK
ncbi:MAG: sulfatase [Ignavibacteriae bacterium]|nr:MAG: sulfatase [Ignavibacteriota bacterium]